MEYTIAAIPTVYNGRRYRSRLEAKWAAFFEILKWHYEYEPYDLGVWSPDFLIHDDVPGACKILTEVKPDNHPHDETLAKISFAINERGYTGGAMLVGSSPYIVTLPDDSQVVHIGWMTVTYPEMTDRERVWHSVGIGWLSANGDEIRVPDILLYCSEMTSVHSLHGGFSRYEGPIRISTFPQNTMCLWDDACNAVQWRGRDA